MSVKFPIPEKISDLGLLIDPVIPVRILTKSGFQSFDFLLDTGADCSMMPGSVASDLGLDLKTLPRISFGGIEGRTILTRIAKIRIKIDVQVIEIMCAFSDNEHCPFILGRRDVFNHYNIYINNRQKYIRFTKI